MKKTILIAAALLFALSGPGYSATSAGQEEARTTIERPTKAPCVKPPDDKTGAGQRGCCSWHGGVCGCEDGRAKCCDGTLSPSCGC